MSSGSPNFVLMAVERLKTLAKAIRTSAETARRDIYDLKNLADEVDTQVSWIDQSVCRLSEYDWMRHVEELESLLTETSSVVAKNHGTQYLSWLWPYLGQSGQDEIKQQRQKLSGWSESFWDCIEASEVTTSLNSRSSSSENAPSHPALPYSVSNSSVSIAGAEAAIPPTTALSMPDVPCRSVEGSPTPSVIGWVQSPMPATASPSPSIPGTTQLPPSAGNSPTASPSTAFPPTGEASSHVPDPTQSSASRGGSTPDTGRNTNSSTVQPIYQNYGNAPGWVIQGGTMTNNFGNYSRNPAPP